MRILHECERNIPDIDMQVYSYDKGNAWYIKAHIVFFCPYCGIELKKLEKEK